MHAQVLTPPSDDEWFTLVVEDVVKLQGTNNFVPIFNTGAGHSKRAMLLFSDFECSKRYKGIKQRPPSDAKYLARVKEFTEHWFDRMQQRVERLGLMQKPRQKMENTVLISAPGCRKQKIHFDFDATQVQALIKDARYEGIPLSVLCSFTPTGSDIHITGLTGAIQSIHLDFGDMLIFTGDVLHGGAAYEAWNLRGFFHIVHPELCPYDNDTTYFQFNPRAKPKRKNEHSKEPTAAVRKTLGAKRVRKR